MDHIKEKGGRAFFDPRIILKHYIHAFRWLTTDVTDDDTEVEDEDTDVAVNSDDTESLAAEEVESDDTESLADVVTTSGDDTDESDEDEEEDSEEMSVEDGEVDERADQRRWNQQVQRQQQAPFWNQHYHVRNIQVVDDNASVEDDPNVLYCWKCRAFRNKESFSKDMRAQTAGRIFCLSHSSSSGFGARLIRTSG